MIVAVPRETASGERRVALTPRQVGRLVERDHRVAVQREAGKAAGFPDEGYREAGAEIAPDMAAALSGAEAVLMVGPPGASQGDGDPRLDLLPEGCLLLGFLDPHGDARTLERLATRRITALAVELLPRITRAQTMDALSSMATVAGYRAALLAAGHLNRFFPMLTTAAGTVSPAKALVLGAGVAGLQAIATCRRLGARVSAFDIRPEVKEQVESLGAHFLEWEPEEEVVSEGGYAGEVSEETKRREQEMVAGVAAGSDVVITTALVPGRRAPILVTADTVGRMRPGSVVVDLAAPAGGNCELTRPGETVEHEGVTVLGPLNLPSTLAHHASQMYGRNLLSLFEHVLGEDGDGIDLEDEIVGAVCVTHDGRVRLGDRGSGPATVK